MRKSWLIYGSVFAVFFLFLSSVSFAATINFDSVPIPDNTSEWQDSGAIFSTDDGDLLLGDSTYDGSQCLGASAGSGLFQGDIEIRFTNNAVASGLSLYLINPESADTITVAAFDASNSPLPITATDNTVDHQLFDFSSFSVLRVEISDSTTGNQFGIDEVVFSELNTVPVPGAIWLFGSGLIGLVAFRGRKRR